MVFLCVILSLFVLFSSVTETLGSEEILDDMLDEISAIKRDMNKMKNDMDKMKNDFDERKGDLDEMMDSRLDKLLRQVEELRDTHLTPKTTILTSSTLPPITTTPPPPPPPTLPPQPSACSSYTELSDAWRHIDYVNRGDFPPNCDKTGSSKGYYTYYIKYTNLAWGSWFRFTGAAGNKMPTAPAPGGGPSYGKYICGTSAVAYISSGGNPTIQDGIVTRDVCFEYGSYSCLVKTTVGVAACRDMHGEYFVYQLQPVTDCDLAYCAID